MEPISGVSSVYALSVIFLLAAIFAVVLAMIRRRFVDLDRVFVNASLLALCIVMMTCILGIAIWMSPPNW
jgi:hypothetical protein